MSKVVVVKAHIYSAAGTNLQKGGQRMPSLYQIRWRRHVTTMAHLYFLFSSQKNWEEGWGGVWLITTGPNGWREKAEEKFPFHLEIKSRQFRGNHIRQVRK